MKKNQQLHPKIKDYCYDKITEDLKSKNIITFKNEIWVLDLDTKDWYLTICAEGSTWYNQNFFKTHLHLFSLSNREISSIIKEWIENNFEIRITNVSRRQNNITYIIDGMLRSTKNKWDINKRFGFSYEVVKKMIGLENEIKNVLVEDFISYQ